MLSFFHTFVGILEMGNDELRESIDQIWNQFSNSLKGFIRKRVSNEYDVEDILQDVFCKIHDKIYKLKNEDRLQAWIYQITRNAITDYYRRRKAVGELSGLNEEMPDKQSDEFDEGDDFNDDMTACLEPMINNLPDKYKEVIILSHFRGLSQKEMAEKLGISYSGVKSRVQRARAKLREMFLECCHFEFDSLGNILEYQHKGDSCGYCHKERE